MLDSDTNQSGFNTLRSVNLQSFSYMTAFEKLASLRDFSTKDRKMTDVLSPDKAQLYNCLSSTTPLNRHTKIEQRYLFTVSLFSAQILQIIVPLTPLEVRPIRHTSIHIHRYSQ